MAKIVDGLIGRPPILLILLGVAVFALSAAGAVVFKQGSFVLDETPWRLALAVLGIAIIGFGAYLLWSERGIKLPPKPLPIAYDLFVASPMAANATPETKAQRRAETLSFIDEFRAATGCQRIYYAGTKIRNETEYEPPDVAARVDLDALRRSRTFVMYYPEKSMSSVIFEAGFALAIGKPAVYLVTDTTDLPFLMQTAPNLPAEYPNVRIYECADPAAILKLIKTSGANLFDAGPA